MASSIKRLEAAGSVCAWAALTNTEIPSTSLDPYMRTIAHPEFRAMLSLPMNLLSVDSKLSANRHSGSAAIV